MPKLKLRYRMILYISMVVFSALSLISLVIPKIPFLINILIYCVAVFALVFGIIYLVKDIRHFIRDIVKPQIMKNKYTRSIATDFRLRTIVFTVPGAGINILFAIFNGVMGIISSSPWIGSMAAYYILLSMIRSDAVKQSRKLINLSEEERIKTEIKVYKRGSRLFLFMGIVTTGMVILLISSKGGKIYPGYMIYVAAMYSFYKIITSTIQIIKVGKEKSPLLTILRRIGYLDACVSILILQTAMFASFGDGRIEFEKLMNGVTGAVVSLLVLGMGLYGMKTAAKLENKLVENGGNQDG